MSQQTRAWIQSAALDAILLYWLVGTVSLLPERQIVGAIGAATIGGLLVTLLGYRLSLKPLYILAITVMGAGFGIYLIQDQVVWLATAGGITAASLSLCREQLSSADPNKHIGVAVLAFVMPLLSLVLGTESLFVMSILGMGGIIYFDVGVPTALPALQQARQGIQANPYIAILQVLTGVTLALVLFSFLEEARPETNTSQIAGGLGILIGFAHVAMLGIRSRREARPEAGLTVPPTIAVGMIVLSVIALVVGTGGDLLLGLSVAGIYAIVQTVQHDGLTHLYRPMQNADALRAIINRLVPLVSGGILMILLLPQTALPVAFIVAILWGIANRLAYKTYAVLVRETLQTRVLGLGDDVLITYNASNAAVLRTKLKSSRPGEAIYALNFLEKFPDEPFHDHLGVLLTHPIPEVRREAALRIEHHRPPQFDVTLLDILIEADDDSHVKEAAIRAYAATGGTLERLDSYLKSPDDDIRRGVLVAFLQHGDTKRVQMAEAQLLQLSESLAPQERSFAAQILANVDSRRFYGYMLKLLEDPNPKVQSEAILAAGKLNNPRLWDKLIGKLLDVRVAPSATTALFTANRTVYPAFETVFQSGNPQLILAVTRICGQRREAQAIELLKTKLTYPNTTIRDQVVRSLQQCRYQAEPDNVPTLHNIIRDHIQIGIGYFAIIRDLRQHKPTGHIVYALAVEIESLREDVLSVLSLLYDPQTVQAIQTSLKHPDNEKQDAALRTLEILLDKSLRPLILPLFSRVTVNERLSHWQSQTIQKSLPPNERLLNILQSDLPPWLLAYTLFAIQSERAQSILSRVLPLTRHDHPLVSETAIWVVYTHDEAYFEQECVPHLNETQQAIAKTIQTSHPKDGDPTMLLTIEKVLILKSVDIFSRLPDGVLVQLANIVEEIDLLPNASLFEESDVGNSMFIITQGSVRIERDGVLIATRGERDFIGEMSLFGDAPRSASAIAETEVNLLRLDQIAFNELMANHPPIAKGIITVLANRLREAMELHGLSPLTASISSEDTITQMRLNREEIQRIINAGN